MSKKKITAANPNLPRGLKAARDRVLALAAAAETLDPEDAAAALVEATRTRREFESFFTPAVQAADKAHKQAIRLRDSFVKPIKGAENAFRRVVAAAAESGNLLDADGETSTAIVPEAKDRPGGKVTFRRSTKMVVVDERAAILAIIKRGPDSPLVDLLKIDSRALRSLATALPGFALPGVEVETTMIPSVRLAD